MANYVDSIILTLDGTDMDDVILELTEDSDMPTKLVNTMNRVRRGRGFKSGNVVFNLTAKVEQSDDPKLPNWFQMQSTRKSFTITKRPNAGAAVSYLRCRITKVSDSSQDGDSSRSLTIMALERM